MSAMIKDLLEFTRSRLGAGVPVSPAATDIGVLCSVAVDEASNEHPTHAFHLEIAGNLKTVADSERLRQVLHNLLTNAVRFGTRGKPILLAARGDDESITVQVINHGPVIPKDELRVIFNPMVHIPGAEESERPMPPANLGLGLFIAREIIIAHGGQINASSSDTVGTVFSFTLPRRRP